MFGKNKKEKLIYGIIGLGRFGLSLAIELAESGADLIVLDHDEDKIGMIREYTDNAFIVKNLEKQTLIDAGIKNCDIVVVGIGGAIDTSILVTLTLVGMGIKKVIAKATSTEHGEVLQKLGAEVVYPERDMAIRLANRLSSTMVLDFVQLSEKINISKISVPKGIIDKTVKEANLRQKYGLNIIAIENEGTLVEMIGPDYIFRDKDILFLAGDKKGLLEVSNLD